MSEKSEVEVIRAEGVCPPQGLYSHAVAAGPGRFVFLAGQTAVDENNRLVGEGDFRRQMEQVYENLKRILESAGSALEKVVKYTTYLTRSDDLTDFYAVRAEIYARLYPDGQYPPNTLVVVDQLAREEWLIEIEATALI